jgi:hypothetical protein
MGTVGNCIHAISFGIFWGLGMWVWDMGEKPHPRLRRSLGGFLIYGSAYGIWDTFDNRTFHSPIVLVFIPTAVCGLLILFSARPKASAKS